jgi:hypothetical protein
MRSKMLQLAPKCCKFHRKWKVRTQNAANTVEMAPFSSKMLQNTKENGQNRKSKKKQNGKKQIPKQFRTHIFHSFFCFPLVLTNGRPLIHCIFSKVASRMQNHPRI